MTMHASRHGNREVKVMTTYGPITNTVTEDASHLRYFWHQLGQTLDEIEKDAQKEG